MKLSLLATLSTLALSVAPSSAAAGGLPYSFRPPPAPATHSPSFTYNQFLSALRGHKIVSAVMNEGTQQMQLSLRNGTIVTFTYPSTVTDLPDRMVADGVKLTVNSTKSSSGGSFFGSLFGFLLIGGLLMLVLSAIRRKRPNQNGGPEAAEQSRLRTDALIPQRPATSFADVGGCEEVITDLKEIVDFLKNSGRYQRMGAKLPRGAMLYGPPGTGKTLMAKAVAGEAGLPFFAVSGSEFVELFVGVGAKRVRQLFEKARAQKEGAIIFFDEIDAIGRARSRGGLGNNEQEQTLNQLLVELDGFSSTAKIFCIAATNRLDMLDPALLRRFTRQVEVSLPDENARLQILNVHAEGKRLAVDVDLKRLARYTAQLSGSQLAEIMNEGAILAARHQHETITVDDLDEAHTRVLLGPEKPRSMLSEEERLIVAYHEAGHVLAAELCPNVEKTLRATIRQRSRALGHAFRGATDKALYDIHYLHETMVVCLAGRAAEQLVFSKVSSGAQNDLSVATSTARTAIEELGLSDRIGQFISLSSGDTSDETRRAIEEEGRRLVADAYQHAYRLLEDHRSALEKIAQLLLEQEDVDWVDIQAAIDGLTGEVSLQPDFGALSPEPKKTLLRREAENGDISEEKRPVATRRSWREAAFALSGIILQKRSPKGNSASSRAGNAL